MADETVVLRGRSAMGKKLVRDLGPVWIVVGENGPNVLILSPPAQPTQFRAVRRVGDANFEVIAADD